MAPGTITKLGAPMFEPEVFPKQMYCIEESTCDIVGPFRRSTPVGRRAHGDSAPGELCPSFPFRYAPSPCIHKLQSCINTAHNLQH